MGCTHTARGMGCTHSARGFPTSSVQAALPQQPRLLARRLLQDQGFQPSPCRRVATVRKAAASQATDFHSECKYAGNDSKAVPVRANPQHRDGGGRAPAEPRLPGTSAADTSISCTRGKEKVLEAELP